MDQTLTDTIDMHGDPLGFKLKAGTGTAQPHQGRRVIKVEARQMAAHQKEAVVTEADGCAWRLTSDEGKHLRGTDLSPFPLGFFNAGLQSDLAGRISGLAARNGIALDGIEISAVNHYWLTGSFIQGTGEGHAEPPDIEIRLQSTAGRDAIEALVKSALDASPAIALLRTPLTANSFALYINGRRRRPEDVTNSEAPEAADPYRSYAKPPRPLAGGRSDLIEKTGQQEAGATELAPPTVNGKLLRNIHGTGKLRNDGLFETDTWLGLPGCSHFRLLSDDKADAAPSGLALLSAGVAFCYMTQLSRYIENMKMSIRRVRLVQFNPFEAGDRAAAEPIDTHLFLDGEAPDETHAKLLSVAARTCYLHAAAKTPTEPNVRIVHNGQPFALAA
jgi:hypothetical protein